MGRCRIDGCVAGILLVIAVLVAPAGCAPEPQTPDDGASCVAGTPAGCADEATLALCADGARVFWDCDADCGERDLAGACESRDPAPAACVCRAVTARQTAALCPAPARIDDDACVCDSAQRRCVSGPYDTRPRLLAYCADGELRFQPCLCSGGDTGYCEEGAAPGTATCRCEACEERADRCAGRSCGDDGCGGSCGVCGAHETCDEGRCVAVPWCGDGTCAGWANGEDCQTCPADCGCDCGETCERGLCRFSACDGRSCGDDGCGGTCAPGCGCGETCQGGECRFEGCAFVECGFDTAGCGVPCGPGCDSFYEECRDGRCVAVDRCAGKECGSDGRGGSCGSCACFEACEDGRCVPVDRCDGRVCGANVCGVSCGECAPGFFCRGGQCETTCEGTVCGGPGGPVDCCVGDEVCVGFQCCAPDVGWVCVDGRSRRRVDGCGNRAAAVEPCPEACDPDSGACVPCERLCHDGVCRDGVCQPIVCGDGRCDPEAESCATCPLDCGAGDGCVPGAVAFEDCGRCGTRAQACAADCTWGAPGACEGEGECLPGDLDERSCAGCGVERRVCDAGCVWGEWGDCQRPECCDAADCGGGQVCRDGTCRPDCADECAPGARACAGRGAVRHCEDRDGDGCLTWGPPKECPADAYCRAGECRTF